MSRLDLPPKTEIRTPKNSRALFSSQPISKAFEMRSITMNYKIHTDPDECELYRMGD